MYIYSTCGARRESCACAVFRYACIYIYIYRERERERETYIYIYIHTYIHTPHHYATICIDASCHASAARLPTACRNITTTGACAPI